MPPISIKIDLVKNSIYNVGSNVQRVSSIKKDISSLRISIDSSIRARRNINSRLNSAYERTEDIEKRIRDLANFVGDSTDKYHRVDNTLKNLAVTIGSMGNNGLEDGGGNYPKTDMPRFEPGDGTYFRNGKNEYLETENNGESWINRIRDILKGAASEFGMDILENALTIGSSAFYQLPKFDISKCGKYVIVFNGEYYKNGGGLARRYTLNNILSGKYPNATKLYNLSKGLKTFGKVMTGIAMAQGAYEEFVSNPDITLERKISNSAVEAVSVLASIKAGAVIGGAIGSILPGPGTVVGAVVGAGISMVATYGVGKLLDWKIFDGGNKSTKDVIKDVVGDIAEQSVKSVGDCLKGAGQWVGGLFKPKPVTGAFARA